MSDKLGAAEVLSILLCRIRRIERQAGEVADYMERMIAAVETGRAGKAAPEPSPASPQEG